MMLLFLPFSQILPFPPLPPTCPTSAHFKYMLCWLSHTNCFYSIFISHLLPHNWFFCNILSKRSDNIWEAIYVITCLLWPSGRQSSPLLFAMNSSQQRLILQHNLKLSRSSHWMRKPHFKIYLLCWRWTDFTDFLLSSNQRLYWAKKSSNFDAYKNKAAIVWVWNSLQRPTWYKPSAPSLSLLSFESGGAFRKCGFFF